MTKLFLSSLDQNYRNIAKESIENCRYLLITYFYARNAVKDERFLKTMEYFNSNNRLIVDSGAFSFMNGKRITEEKLNDYCREYVNFLIKYKIKRFVEMDVDAIMGYDKVLAYRKYIEKQTHRQCIPIFHKSRGKKAFIEMVKKYEYAGIGGIAIKNIKPSEFKYFRQLNIYAKEHHCKLHAMGFTPTKNINSYGFYSCDSSSWCSGVRFGTVYQFRNDGSIRSLHRPKGYRLKIDRNTIQNHNWNEWCKYQRYVDGS